MNRAERRSPAAAPTYQERMPAPAGVWVAVLGVWLLFCLAMGGTVGPWLGLPLLVLGGGGLVYGLRAAAGRIEVTADSLVAGRARLTLEDAGPAQPLDAEAARVLRGTGADSRAYLYLRSWVPTAVRVEVEDPSDPTPYWYVSTRRPAALVAALDAAKGREG